MTTDEYEIGELRWFKLWNAMPAVWLVPLSCKDHHVAMKRYVQRWATATPA